MALVRWHFFAVVGFFRSGSASDDDPGRSGRFFTSGRPQIGGKLSPHRYHERLDADDVQDAREIVSKHVQCHLGGHAWQRLHQEVGCAHPRLDRAEGMLDRLTSLPHLFRMLIEPALHRLENVLMLPSGDQSFLAGGAAMLDDAVPAGVGLVTA